MTDAQLDAEANAICAASPPSNENLNYALSQEEPSEASPPSLLETSPPQPPQPTYIYRAAETSEIMLRSIEGIPAKNTAIPALIGTCPHCEGDEDEADSIETHAS